MGIHMTTNVLSKWLVVARNAERALLIAGLGVASKCLAPQQLFSLKTVLYYSVIVQKTHK
jgi:hypothetical protein